MIRHRPFIHAFCGAHAVARADPRARASLYARSLAMSAIFTTSMSAKATAKVRIRSRVIVRARARAGSAVARAMGGAEMGGCVRPLARSGSRGSIAIACERAARGRDAVRAIAAASRDAASFYVAFARVRRAATTTHATTTTARARPIVRCENLSRERTP